MMRKTPYGCVLRRLSGDKKRRLTVVISLRTHAAYDVVQRLQYRREDTDTPDEVNFLVVDDGSDAEGAARVVAMCEQLGFDYLRLETSGQKFALARTRNLGAMYATGEFVLFEDVDLIAYPGFYRSLLLEIEAQEMTNNVHEMLSVPVGFFTPLGTETYFATAPALRQSRFLRYLFEGRSDIIGNVFPASSVVLIHRYFYLSIGGHNEAFQGWGLEDLEFNYRCTKLANRFLEPSDPEYLVLGKEFSQGTRYRGWRMRYRLHGDELASKGIVQWHAHHPVNPEWNNASAHARNMELFHECVQRFDEKGHYLEALPDMNRGRSLSFNKGVFVHHRGLIPWLGERHIVSYKSFDEASILDYIRVNDISKVVFTNPYASDERLSIYKAVKAAGIPHYVSERGALRNSLVVDPSGFCAESLNYTESRWNRELTDAEHKRVRAYISDERSRSETLEQQPPRRGARETLAALGIAPDKKVLFVPLQSRSDVTIKYFCGDIESYDKFIELVADVTRRLDKSWVVVVKPHPLSKRDETVPGAIVTKDAHIKDLLDIADWVLLINSGVGVLSALWGKPVIHTGRAFYASELLNRKAITSDDVLRHLESGFRPTQEASERFISYLISSAYCFGAMTTQLRDYTDDSMMSTTEGFDCYESRVDGTTLLMMPEDRSQTRVPASAPAYARFNRSLIDDSTGAPLARGPLGKLGRKARKLVMNPRAFVRDALVKRTR
jgi:predicted glycosyltransferase involved in capsule biosynthesis